MRSLFEFNGLNVGYVFGCNGIIMWRYLFVSIWIIRFISYVLKRRGLIIWEILSRLLFLFCLCFIWIWFRWFNLRLKYNLCLIFFKFMGNLMRMRVLIYIIVLNENKFR